jgi:hypothetical protein
MAIGSTNYAHPVYVNGFICRNCTDVDNAKKHIDPAHPKSGPYGIDAATDPTNPKRSIELGQDLAGTRAEIATRPIGSRVDIRA